MTNADKEKIRAAAQKYLQKGQIGKAIKELERIVADDPNDLRALLKIGDLQTREKNNEAATRVYAQVAAIYVKQNFLQKAVAVYKQIALLDPKFEGIHQTLGSLYEQLGLNSEAANQYRVLCQELEHSGRTQDLMTLLRKMVVLDPNHIPSRIKLAEIELASGFNSEARESFRVAANFFKLQQRLPEYFKLAEYIVALDETDVSTALDLADFYLQNRESKKALSKLQICYKLNPRHVPTLSLLARAFSDTSQNGKALAMYREIGLILHEENDIDGYRNAMKEVLKLAPHDPEAQIAVFNRLQGQGEAFGADETQAREPFPKVGSETEIEHEISAVLREVDSFVRYGLKDKAVSQIAELLQSYPNHLKLLSRQRELLLSIGRKPELANIVAKIAEVATELGDISLADNSLVELEQLDPQHETLSRLRPVKPDTLVDEIIVDTEALPTLAEMTLNLEPSELEQSSNSQNATAAENAEFVAALGDDLETSDQISLEDIVRSFKYAVRTQIDIEDYESHYNLGLAFHEMGLLPEAMEEFAIASRSPRYAVEANMFMGIDEYERKDYVAALQYFETGLAEPNISEHAITALQYEMGLVYERMNKFTEAAACFEKVRSAAPDFRDVAARLQAVKKNNGTLLRETDDLDLLLKDLDVVN